MTTTEIHWLRHGVPQRRHPADCRAVTYRPDGTHAVHETPQEALAAEAPNAILPDDWRDR